MYGKETLELEDVRQMLQNNEVMKNDIFYEGGLMIVCQGSEREIKE